MPDTVDPREVAFALHCGDWMTVTVDGHGAGWTITAVYGRAFRVYRDGVEMTVPHGDVRQDG